MQFIKPLLLAASCLTCVLIALSPVMAKEWHGIIPLYSSRNDAERLLAPLAIKPVWYTSFFCEYKTMDGDSVSIWYSTESCNNTSEEGWNVSPGTVIVMTVYPRTKISILSTGLNLNNFEVTASGHVGGVTRYTDYIEGLSIEVNNGIATSYEYFPAAGDYHLKCQKIHIPETLQPFCESQIFPFDPSGSFVTKLNNDTKEVRFILAVKQKDNSLSGAGRVITADGTEFPLESVSISTNSLSFLTVEKNETSFKFEGKWLRSGNFAKSKLLYGTEVLRGTVTKIHSGNIIGKITTFFSYIPECQ